MDSIKADEELKQKTKEYLSKKSNHYVKKPFSQARKIATAFACIALVSIIMSGYGMYFTKVAALSIDVNPSVELGINRFDKVISVEAKNEDGEIIASNADVKYMDYADALDCIVTDEALQAYVNTADTVYITAIGNTDEKTDEIISKINANCTCVKQENVSCEKGNSLQAKEAKDAGLPYGKYKMYLELKKLDENITIDDVKEMTMKQLKEKCDSLCTDDNGNQNKNGNKYQNGHKNEQ